MDHSYGQDGNRANCSNLAAFNEAAEKVKQPSAGELHFYSGFAEHPADGRCVGCGAPWWNKAASRNTQVPLTRSPANAQ